MTKIKISEVIVVEGIHDIEKVHQCVEAYCIATNGMHITKETLLHIKQMNDEKGVIVLCDDDTPGRKIRSQIQAFCGCVKHGFIDKKESRTNKKVGIEHASCQSILKALENIVTLDNAKNSITWIEYLSLELGQNQRRRAKFCKELSLPMMNHKRLFKTLNQLGLTLEKLRRKTDG